MRYILPLVMTLSLGFAQEAAEPGTAPAPSAEPAQQEEPAPEGAKPYLELIAAHKAFLQALADSLKDITDTASANAAVPQVAELQEQARALLKQEDDVLALGAPGGDVLEYLEREGKQRNWEELTAQSIVRALELLNTTPACYGSRNLETVIERVLEIYLGEGAE